MDDRQIMSKYPVATKKKFRGVLNIDPNVTVRPHITKLLAERSEILFALAKQRDGCYDATLNIGPRLQDIVFIMRLKRPEWHDCAVAAMTIMPRMLYDSPLESWPSYCDITVGLVERGIEQKLIVPVT